MEQVLDVNVESPYMYGMLSFGLLEVGRIREAESFARLALLIEGQDPWAQHAVCVCMDHAILDCFSFFTMKHEILSVSTSLLVALRSSSKLLTDVALLIFLSKVL